MGGRVWPLTVSGPLAPYGAGYVSWLEAQGFSPGALGGRVWQLDDLSRWLEQEGLVGAELTSGRVEEFLVARRAAGYVTWVSPLSMRMPLLYLREVGVVPMSPSVVAVGRLEELLGDYRGYLACERGLVADTIARYVRVARLFLEQREQPDGLGLERLTAADVSVFLARECPKRDGLGCEGLGVQAAVCVALSACGGLDRSAAAVGGAGSRRSPGSLASSGVRPGRGREASGELRSATDGRASRLRDLALDGAAGAACWRCRGLAAR